MPREGTATDKHGKKAIKVTGREVREAEAKKAEVKK